MAGAGAGAAAEKGDNSLARPAAASLRTRRHLRTSPGEAT